MCVHACVRMCMRVCVLVLPVGRVALDCALLIGRGPATLAQSFLQPELHHWPHYPVRPRRKRRKDFFNYYRSESESTKLLFTYRQSSANFCAFGKHLFCLPHSEGLLQEHPGQDEYSLVIGWSLEDSAKEK